MAKYPDYFYERLLQQNCPFAHPDWPPILFFGNFGAKIASVGRNPSPREYTDAANDGPRLLTWSGVRDGTSVNDEAACDAIIDMMVNYFDQRRVWLDWFEPLIRLFAGVGKTYQAGEVVHLDLIHEATDPIWSTFASRWPVQFAELLLEDIRLTKRQLLDSSIEVIFCNGESAYSAVKSLFANDCDDDLRHPPGSSSSRHGKFHGLRWVVRTLNVADGRNISLVGWQPQIQSRSYTRLDDDGEEQFGAHLFRALQSLGIQLP